jgi:hypothetical protein
VVDPPVDDFGHRGSAKRDVLAAFNKKTFRKSQCGKRSRKMKTKVLLAVVVLSCAPLGVAGNKAEYPNEKVAEFVIEKLDVTSLPSMFRPKKEKGKKTFADYGFAAQRVDENEAVIEAAGRVRGWQSRFSTRNPQESTCVLLNPEKTAARQRHRVCSC